MFFESAKTESVSFEPLPLGLYTIVCVSSEYGPTKAGTGAILKVQFAVEGDERKLFDSFNMENPNPIAVKIGRGQLKDMCEKMGKPNLAGPDDLLGGKLRCEVKHEEYNGNTNARIKKYIKLADSGMQAASPMTAAASPMALNSTPLQSGIHDEQASLAKIPF